MSPPIRRQFGWLETSTVIVAALLCLYPPWTLTVSTGASFTPHLGFHWLFAPSRVIRGVDYTTFPPNAPVVVHRVVDVGLLTLELCIVLFLHWVGRFFKRLVREMVEHRRLEAGLCRKCGYNLVASPRRCPECGHVSDPGESIPHLLISPRGGRSDRR